MGDLCDNIGLVLVCLPSGSTDVAPSPSQYMTQLSRIPILSPVLFMHVGNPYILPFDLLVTYKTYSLYLLCYDAKSKSNGQSYMGRDQYQNSLFQKTVHTSHISHISHIL